MLATNRVGETTHTTKTLSALVSMLPSLFTEPVILCLDDTHTFGLRIVTESYAMGWGSVYK